MSNAKLINSVSDVFQLANENKTLMGITIELLTKCNWRCKHCYLPTHDDDGLSKEIVFDLLSQLRSLGCYEVEFTGGEIFYRKDTMDIIRKAREMYFNVVLFTNVSLLDEDKIKELAEMYVNEISCTIFSLDESIHDSITGVKGSLKKAMENIMLMKKYNMDLQIKTILMNSNYDSYKKLSIFCKENGFRYLATSDIFPRRNGDCSTEKLLLSRKQLEEILPDIDKIRNFSKRSVSPNDYLCDNCQSIRLSVTIDSTGNVFPCNLMPISVGDIFKTSLSDIWHNSSKLKELQELKWRDLNSCMSCEKREYCSRCPGIAYETNGSFLEKTLVDCEITNVRYKNALSNI